MITFRREDRPRVAAGEITVTFRLWRTAKVKAGKQYRTGIGTLEIEDVAVIPAAMISKSDIAPSGCASIAAIRESAGEHTKTLVTPETLLHRVQFRFLGDVPPSATPTTVLDIDAIAPRLARMDERSARGPWTLDVLRLIERAPLVPARILSAELEWERLDFKAHVRRLKRLGLTISHEIGYELSPLGQRYLKSVDAPTRPKRGAAARSRRTPARSRS
jgi:hypothetical protein